MMVSPEWYYEENLKGKTEDQIRSQIRSLKRKIRKLEKVVADPEEYPKEWMFCPSPKVQLEMYRLYLLKAGEALMDTIEYLECDQH